MPKVRGLRGLSLLIALLVMSSPSNAGFDTGNQLWDACQNREDAMNTVRCVGYVRGAVDALTFAASTSDLFCLRNGVTAGQVRDVVVNHLAQHPQDRDRGATILVLNALVDAFPCQ